MKIACAHCQKKTDKPAGAVNRARGQGLRIFCDRRCAGLARRKHKTKAQRVTEKRDYDAAYREANRAMLKAKKAERHRRTYDAAKARVERKKRAPFHAEYCRRPEYRRWKSGYDRRYRAKEFGPFADAYLLAVDLNKEIKRRSSNYEIRIQNGTLNKKQARTRASSDSPSSRDRHRSAQGIGTT